MKIVILVMFIIALVVIVVGGWFLWLLGQAPEGRRGDGYWR
jgi:hypothetical protein